MEKDKISKLITIAKSLVGKPYKYGAKMDEAPDYFDCSGFIKYLYEQIGIELPKSTIEQAEIGKKIKEIKKIKPGDLIFFHGERGHYNKKFPAGIGHVAMYMGSDTAIHAAAKRIQSQPKIVEVGGVKIESVKSIIKAKGPVVAIKRILS